MVPSNPEAQAREIIDRLLKVAGWHVVDRDQINIHAAHGVRVIAPDVSQSTTQIPRPRTTLLLSTPWASAKNAGAKKRDR